MAASKSDLGLVLRAAAFAANKHKDQRRKDAKRRPYINHPIALVQVLCNEAGVEDAEVLAAAVLHDTIEDTKTTEDELTAAFGSVIASTVAEVTDNKLLAKQTRKELQVQHAPCLSERAKLVKLADKICNLRDVLEAPPSHWPMERRRAYFEWAKAVIDGLRGVHPGLEHLFDDAYRLKP